MQHGKQNYFTNQIHIQILSHFLFQIILDELRKEFDELRDNTKTEMNILKDCQNNGKIIGTPISEDIGQCTLDEYESMEQKISSM